METVWNALFVKKKIGPYKNSEEIICLTPGMFICKKEYDESFETEKKQRKNDLKYDKWNNTAICN